MPDCQGSFLRRVNCYYDAFNLYHAVVELGDQQLKWLNIKMLSQSFIRGGESLNEVHFFTSVPTWDAQKQHRHENYLLALRYYGVKIHRGRFQQTEKYCWANERHCAFREEKHTDVAIAVQIIADAGADKFDGAVLITADADQVPTVKYLQERFPGKALRLMAPPGRLEQARDLGNHMNDVGEITRGNLVSHKLPRTIRRCDGSVVAEMPPLYRS